ncbi:LuxR C-terminal-related transcriptional regulator [Chloroflexota bacterium]
MVYRIVELNDPLRGAMSTKTINVLIISPQVLFRQGVESTLSSMEDMRIISSVDYSNGVELSIDNLPPDVAVLDIDGPPETGFELARKIKQRLPNIGIIMLTSNPDDGQLFQALKAQAVAYLSKEVTADQIVHTIRRVANGEYPINESLATRPQVAEHILQQFQELSWRVEAESFISPITPRETEILQYVAEGFLNKQIAAKLEISEQTIKNHVTSILRKLNANARTEAVVIAIKQGLISLS